MWTKIDTWMGKTLFVPIIIRICQRVKITQNTFASYCWMIAILCLLTDPPKGISGWIIYGILVVMAAMSIARAALFPEIVSGSSSGFRFLIVSLGVGLVYIPDIIEKHFAISHVYTIFVLFAEYAKTIKTIPPLEDKKKATKAVEAKA